MNLLVIGGTRFVGRHLVEEAQQRGHDITLFNRGKSNVDLFPDISHIRGDRDVPRDLAQLSAGAWDAVIDTCGYFPRQVREVLDVISTDAHYVFISSISVYSQQTVPHQTEAAELLELDPDTPEEVTGETYGGFKVLCEREAQTQAKCLIARPGVIVGPHDASDRFSYWPWRVASGGQVLAPRGAELPCQFIDARDLASWTLDMLAKGQTGIYNLVNAADSITLGDVLTTSQQLSNSDATVTWVDEAFLQTQEVAAWSELPMWIPGEMSNFMRIKNDAAQEVGLITRPLADTIRDLLTWRETLPEDYQMSAGLSEAREQELLAAWNSRD
ncbi:MAG: NAD-dependent epimerase/dehydratase family protein [Deinococcota bacterium]